MEQMIPKGNRECSNRVCELLDLQQVLSYMKINSHATNPKSKPCAIAIIQRSVLSVRIQTPASSTNTHIP